MNLPPLSQREFDLWRQSNDEKMDRLLNAADAQTDRNITVEGRLSSVEAGEAKNRRASLNSMIVAIITAVLSVLAAWVKSSH